MRVLFVYGNMYALGGIQTWLAQWTARLTSDGHEVALLTRPRMRPHDTTSEALDQIARDAEICLVDWDWTRSARGAQAVTLPECDVVVVCDLEALLVVAALSERLAGRKVVAGVFAPREYCWRAPLLQRRWVGHLARRMVRAFPLENFIFATDGMASQTGECADRDLSEAPVLPLAVDLEVAPVIADRTVDRRKIVSVARLVPYYTHHRQMIEVIERLRGAGHDFTYHAYGDGEDRGALEAEVRQRGLGDAVFFHGWIPHARFREAVHDAFVYIGLGTALIEAAACGIPSLVGIDGHPGPATYGFLQDTSGNDIGGYVPGHPEFPITERVMWLAGLDADAYEEVGRASRARAEEFGLERLRPRMVDILEHARPFVPSVSALDRAVGRADTRLAAALWKLGMNTPMDVRHVRPLAAEPTS